MMLKKFITAESGWATPFALYFVLVIILLGGLSVDTSRAYNQRTVLSAAADSAVLAAAQELPDVDAAREVGLAYLEAFFPKEKYGIIATDTDFVFGKWDAEEWDNSDKSNEALARILDTEAPDPDAVVLNVQFSDDEGYSSIRPHYFLNMIGLLDWEISAQPVALKTSEATPACTSGGALLGSLTDYLFFIADGSDDANWQSASKGYIGDVAVNGLIADERSSGSFYYRGTITTNDTNVGGWNRILNNNPSTANVLYGQTDTITALRQDFDSAMQTLLALEATESFGGVDFSNADARDLDGLDLMDGEGKVHVIHITSGFSSNRAINIYGDADDLFILRWDSDPSTPELRDSVKFSGGGGIVPRGGLTPSNFIHIAGMLDASGGGSTPSALEPYVAELPENVGGGGFFAGYWLTTGDPSKSFENGSFSNAIFVGGWYTTATKYSMTSGTSGVHVHAAHKPSLGRCDADTQRVAGRSRLLK